MRFSELPRPWLLSTTSRGPIPPMWVSRSRVMAAVAVALAALPLAGAVAQTQQSYDTPLYTPQAPAGLDSSYGLPSFGMPGSELPQQKTTAPERAAPVKPDFFPPPSEIALPKPGASIPGRADMETPLYTTSQGSTTSTSTTETPLFDDGSTTWDRQPPR
ncbi:MAG TPA: hypothetical protein VGC09_16795 [Rhodopila sp.]